ncbi:Gfo/Idh/MocA family oxidoreductase [Pseudonocardia kunmingensis]|uniref:Putative dehydrogenase n=1 Tax=Pseudonocardia kunmingensis TaxID=630975 RepID=A0A543D0N2_9PSEU|nr:Gfo/Idh/MocA family oxidoreductase [Pseudonocardia kunmingensis]TQM02914.1 putative dehydrogenase [Pseudonocardia kunmingensis]
MRIGIVGAESSHTAEVLRLVEQERRVPGARVVAVAPVDVDAAPGIDPALLVASPAELVGAVDAVLVLTRDGAGHRGLAEPFLAAGLPVWVDKPFTTRVEDARALLAAARRGGGAVWSRSALRYPDGVRRAADLAAAGELVHLHLTGPADPAGPYSGIAFYGVHLLEAAVEVLGTAGWVQARMAVTATDGAVVATTTLAGTPVTCTFVTPTDAGAVPFHLSAVTGRGVVAKELDLGRDYLLPVVRGFLAACDTRAAEREDDDVLAPVGLVQELRAALAAG